MEESKLDNKFLVPLAIVVAGGLIAGAIYFGASKPAASATGDSTVTVDNIEVAPVTAKDHIVGSSNAELVVIEYSDTECPFCKVFQNTMHDIVNTYGGKVAWVYRQLPIPQLHSKAPKEAEATECAAELGGNSAFWSYIDTVFEKTNSNDSLDPAELPKIASAIGLDISAFNTCLSSGKYTDFITKSIENGVKAGARGTPYSVIVAKNGKKVIVNGAEPRANVTAKIDALLK